MGLFLWALAAGVGYAGYRGYWKLKAMEEGLRQEVAGGSYPEETVQSAAEVAEKPVVGQGRSLPNQRRTWNRGFCSG